MTIENPNAKVMWKLHIQKFNKNSIRVVELSSTHLFKSFNKLCFCIFCSIYDMTLTCRLQDVGNRSYRWDVLMTWYRCQWLFQPFRPEIFNLRKVISYDSVMIRKRKKDSQIFTKFWTFSLLMYGKDKMRDMNMFKSLK